MENRYWVTGVQLAILEAGDKIARDETLSEIGTNQFIGEMPEPFDEYEIIIRKKKSK